MHQTTGLNAIFGVIFSLVLVPNGVVAQTPLFVLKHSDVVSQLIFSSDGNLIAAGCSSFSKEEGDIVLWDAQNGRQIRKLKGFKFAVVGLSFSKDDRFLVSAGFKSTIRIHNVSNGQEVGTIDDIKTLASIKSVGSTGKIASYSDDGLRLWVFTDPPTLKQLPKQPNFGNGTRCQFSLDGRVLAEASNSEHFIDTVPTVPAIVTIWDTETGKALQKFSGQESNNVFSFGLSSDKKLLALGYFFGPKNVEVREAKEGRVVFHASCQSLPTSMSFSPDNRFLVAGLQDGELNVWDVMNSALVKRFHAHSGAIECLAFTSDGQCLATASADRTVKKWKWVEISR